MASSRLPQRPLLPVPSRSRRSCGRSCGPRRIGRRKRPEQPLRPVVASWFPSNEYDARLLKSDQVDIHLVYFDISGERQEFGLRQRASAAL